MTKLLNENLHRYIKTTSTWGSMIVLLLLTAFGFLLISEGAEVSDEWMLNESLTMFLFSIITVAVGVFIKRDYSQRTVNNKLSIGHKRTNIYLANLISGILCAFVIFAVYLVFCFAVGVPMFGLNISSPGAAAVSFLSMLVIIAAHTSMIVILTMSIKGGLGVASAFGLQYILFVISAFAFEEPGEEGNQLLMDILPICQVMQLSFSGISDRIGVILLCSVLCIAVTAAGGIAVFNRAELK